MRRVVLAIVVIFVMLGDLRVVTFAACYPFMRRRHPERFDTARIVAAVNHAIAQEASA